MNYRQIDRTVASREVLERISKWHNETPRIWIPDYEPSKEEIEETIERMTTNECYIGVAEDEVIQGFIWAEKKDNNVMIMSLYVDEAVRQQNIGTYLKEALEAWCRIEGIKKIQTTVHSKNKKMLMLNEKLGYEPKMVHMEKILD